jgi:SAM-dependent methyltransferase
MGMKDLEEIRRLVEEDVPVLQDVSPSDEMYPGDPDHYFGYGQWALRCIRLAAMTARQDGFLAILDFPSGHGRVLRTLKAAFPNARLTACDIDRDAVDYCAETFGAEPVYSQHDPAEIEFHGDFDLIWCGSLFTHLDESRWAGFFELFHRVLRPYGIFLFTTAGRFSAEKLRRKPLGFEDPGFLPRFDERGFSYTEYPSATKERINIPTYGQSISSLCWVIRFLEEQGLFNILLATETGWGEMDVIACRNKLA